MLLDELVLTMANVAVALRLLVWSREENVVGVVEPDRSDVLHLDDSGLDSERERGQIELRA